MSKQSDARRAYVVSKNTRKAIAQRETTKAKAAEKAAKVEKSKASDKE